MKILQICNKPPLPARDGGALAMLAITQGLLDAGHSLQVLSFATHKHPELPAEIPADFKKQTQFETVFADTRVKAIPAFLNLFGSQSYNITRFDVQAMHEKIKAILHSETFDIIHLESLFLAPYLPTIRAHSKARVVLRAHNAEYLVWERMAAESSGFRARYIGLLARRLKNYEVRVMNEFDGIAAITETDAQDFLKLGCRVPVATIPFAMQLPEATEDQQLNDSVFHLGSMDWMPNQLGVKWFTDSVWPLLLQKNKEAKLFLAGRNMPSSFVSGNGITVEGEISDARNFMLSHGIMIVPLQSGSGMRIKVAEAMALGRAVVSTTTGMEGIPALHNEHVLIADNAADFAEVLFRLQKDETVRQRLGKNAQQLVKEIFDRKRVTEKLSEFYIRLIG